jgi:2-polyprenyl-6-methoxyphenol hydroxylase-like FAD-dependent oxidoreductase
MGTSLALCGAYVLAGELGRNDNHAQAFAAYERIMRPYVDQAQGVPKFAPRLASPRSRAGIALGHAVLRMANAPIFKPLLARFLVPKADAIELPDYEHLTRAGRARR